LETQTKSFAEEKNGATHTSSTGTRHPKKWPESCITNILSSVFAGWRRY